MTEQHDRFEYKSLPQIPKEFRQLDWTYINVRDKSLSEGEKAFHQLKVDCKEVFADKPFAYLHFLRGIETRLLSLAVEHDQPIAKCLEYLRRRLDLEYSRGDIGGKAAQAVIVARHAAKCGEIGLATSILKQEWEQLSEMAEICRVCKDNIARQVEELTTCNAAKRGHCQPD